MAVHSGALRQSRGIACDLALETRAHASGWVEGADQDKTDRNDAQRHCADDAGRHSSSTERWNDVPRGTMDEVSSHVCLDLPFV